MQQPYIIAIVAKDAVERIPVVVPAHEMPVLARVHGQHKVTLDEGADLPAGVTVCEFEPDDEYARLEQRYGYDNDTKQSFAQLAYGGLQGFINALGADEKPRRKAA